MSELIAFVQRVIDESQDETLRGHKEQILRYFRDRSQLDLPALRHQESDKFADGLSVHCGGTMDKLHALRLLTTLKEKIDEMTTNEIAPSSNSESTNSSTVAFVSDYERNDDSNRSDSDKLLSAAEVAEGVIPKWPRKTAVGSESSSRSSDVMSLIREITDELKGENPLFETHRHHVLDYFAQNLNIDGDALDRMTESQLAAELAAFCGDENVKGAAGQLLERWNAKRSAKSRPKPEAGSNGNGDGDRDRRKRTDSRSATDEHIPTEAELLAMFKENRSSNKEYRPCINELVELMDGIDAVMDTVLCNGHLTADNRVAMMMHLEEAPPPSLKWKLDPKDNMLYEISPFIYRHVFRSRVVGGLLALCGLMLLLSTGIVSLVDDKIGESRTFFLCHRLAGIVICWLCLVPWLTAALLRVNKAMIPEIAATVDLWIIILSVLMMMSNMGIYMFYEPPADVLVRNVNVVVFASGFIFLLLFVVFVCCFDGIHGLHPGIRMNMTTVMALFCGFSSLATGYVAEDMTINLPQLGAYGRVPVTANLSSYWWVLFLFYTKMRMKTWWFGLNSCILVKHSPLIQWEDNTDARKPSANFIGY